MCNCNKTQLIGSNPKVPNGHLTLRGEGAGLEIPFNKPHLVTLRHIQQTKILLFKKKTVSRFFGVGLLVNRLFKSGNLYGHIK